MRTKKKGTTRWFAAKEYGWGWSPVSWQGWVITILFAGLYALSLIGFSAWVGSVAEAKSELRTVLLGVVEFIVWIAFLTYVLVRICIEKGEKPGWHWGPKRKD